jgi:3-hydroxyisobutyrate dehydrogenase-like beta-hydroxyacid dehydrogenase
MPQIRVGVAGVGRMGSAMAERLLEAGFSVTVHNRTPERTKPLVDAGATAAGTPAELVAASDVVLTVLTDDDAVEAVYAQMLAGGAAGTLFIEASTVRTATITRLAERVHAAGARLVDAPVAGPPPAARAGALLVFVGGESGDVERARPVLEAYARRVVHLGPAGSGTTMKLVLMAPMGIYFAGLAEGLAIGGRLGLDRAAMLEVILDSHGAPPVLRDRAQRLLGAGGPASFEVKGVRKDLTAIVATAQDAGVPASTAAAALGLYAGATVAGFAEADLAHIVDYVQRVADFPG